MNESADSDCKWVVLSAEALKKLADRMLSQMQSFVLIAKRY